MSQRFAQALVGVLELNVLPYHADAHFALRMFQSSRASPASGLSRAAGLQMQQAQNLLVEALGGQRHRHFVNIAHVGRRNDAGFRHVAEKRDFRFQVGAELSVAAANQNVGLNSDAQHFFHAVLRGLGLQFAGGGECTAPA